jgi:hypothetical protein
MKAYFKADSEPPVGPKAPIVADPEPPVGPNPPIEPECECQDQERCPVHHGYD